MGTVYKETFTKPLPAGASTKIIVRKGKRLARWQDAKGKTRTAPLTAAGDRIAVEAGTYTAKYRDGSGIVRKVTTGCRDESAARSILTELERRAVRVKGKLVTAAEDAMIDHQDTPLADHIAEYINHQTAKGTSAERIRIAKLHLKRLVADCGFRHLSDMTAAALEQWLVSRKNEGIGAGNRNEYRQELVGFGNWCVRGRRLITNPFAGVPKADAKGGVTPRTAQAAMRHSSIDLTMNVYTDPKLLDVAGAVEALPALPLGSGPQTAANVLSATGTKDLTPSPLVPTLVPTIGKLRTLQSIVDKAASEAGKIGEAGTIAASACPVNTKDPLTTVVNGSSNVERRRIEKRCKTAPKQGIVTAGHFGSYGLTPLSLTSQGFGRIQKLQPR